LGSSVAHFAKKFLGMGVMSLFICNNSAYPQHLKILVTVPFSGIKGLLPFGGNPPIF
jgi:hypothetical protein